MATIQSSSHGASRPWLACGILTAFSALVAFAGIQSVYLHSPAFSNLLAAFPATNQAARVLLIKSEADSSLENGAIAKADGECGRLAESAAAESDPICWWSGDHDGYSGDELDGRRSARNGPVGTVKRRRGKGGVVILGEGCSRCAVGELCTFEIAVRPPAKWVATARPRQQGQRSSSSSARIGVGGLRESLLVRLLGPALAAADVTADEGDVTRWRVTYRVWDAGNYSVLVQSECDTLDFAPRFKDAARRSKSHIMAKWVLSVLPYAAAAPSLLQTAAAPPSEISPVAAGTASLTDSQLTEEIPTPNYETDGPDSPCDHSIHGRWLFDSEQRAYTWQLYPCAHPLPPSFLWPAALQSHGISEINFVGDSHVRFLFNHLFFLLTGKANASTVKYHDTIHLLVPPAPSARVQQPLKLNFYWLGGIYENGTFGCSDLNVSLPGGVKFPNISATADVTVVDAGFWMVAFCDEPEKAFGYYFPNFLEWVKSQRQLAQQQPREKQQQQQQDLNERSETDFMLRNGPQFLFRSVPPKRPNDECGWGTHRLISHFNRLAAAHLGRYGMGFFNDWHIAAPRSEDTCGHKDPHYSCFDKGRKGRVKDTDGAYIGPVGEAMVRMFVYHLLYMMD